MKLSVYFLCTAMLLSFGCEKSCKGKEEARQPRVFFISPTDQEIVTSPVTIKFGVEGMKIKPAGEDINDKTSGHHHLFIDDPKGFLDKGQASPTDATHIHYGKGETETTINLTPGKHSLSLQFADGAHLSYGKEMSATITIEVKSAE